MVSNISIFAALTWLSKINPLTKHNSQLHPISKLYYVLVSVDFGPKIPFPKILKVEKTIWEINPNLFVIVASSTNELMNASSSLSWSDNNHIQQSMLPWYYHSHHLLPLCQIQCNKQ